MSVHAVGPRLREIPADRPLSPVADATGLSAFASRNMWIAGAAVAALVVAAGLTYALTGSKPAPVAAKNSSALSVTVQPAVITTMTRALSVTGTLSAVDELPVGTETVGLSIREVLVDEDDEVKAGQVLARFDDDVLKADVLQKEAALQEAHANASEANANIKRAEDLFRTNAVSAQQVDNRRATAATAAARVAVAEANLAQSKVQMRRAELRAPTDGRIMVRMARVGAVPASGLEMFRILREDRVQLAADVPETELAVVKAGQKVQLVLDGPLANRPFEGSVRLVSPVVDPKTRLGTVKIDLPRDPQLRPGMFAHGKIALGSMQALVAPDSAVVYKDAKPLVFVAGADNKAVARYVVTGTRENGLIAIDSNLKPGEPLITSGVGYLKDGDDIEVVAAAAADTIKPLPKAY